MIKQDARGIFIKTLCITQDTGMQSYQKSSFLIKENLSKKTEKTGRPGVLLQTPAKQPLKLLTTITMRIFQKDENTEENY